MANIHNDPLFVGLTRPTLLFGVSVNYAMVNGLVGMMYFINKSDFKVVPIMLVVHLIGYIACFKEPRFMEIYLMKAQKTNKCINKSFYGANSYYV